jgi:endonuclease/exonuclease/phosphatase family metal-dependent hydrolase
LNGLREILPLNGGKTAVIGDFNQRIPRKYTRQDVFDLMIDTFAGFDFATAGIIQPIGKLSIDHLCTQGINGRLSVTSINNVADGVTLSDHFGLLVDV